MLFSQLLVYMGLAQAHPNKQLNVIALGHSVMLWIILFLLSLPYFSPPLLCEARLLREEPYIESLHLCWPFLACVHCQIDWAVGPGSTLLGDYIHL